MWIARMGRILGLLVGVITMAASPGSWAADSQGLPASQDTIPGAQARMVGDQVVIACQRFELRFAADGKPASFLLLPERKELLDQRNPGNGFVVTNRAGQQLPLSRLTLDPAGHSLTAAMATAGPVVHFRVQVGRDYISFHVSGVDRFGFASSPDLSLAFEMNCDPSVRAVPQNWMAAVDRPGEQIRVSWPNLWTTSKGDPAGGFTLYQRQGDADEDDLLLHIWAETGIAHPAVKDPWTYERAKAWVDEWMRQFGRPTGTMMLEPRVPADLYTGLEYAQAAGISEVYLMPWIWRGEYWPIKATTAAINTGIFPRGESDLLAFSHKVQADGMTLGLHWVSAGVGFQDPVYIGTKPDRRLASWGSGTLEKAVDAKDSTLLFRPAPGVAAPYNAPPSFGESLNFPPALPPFQQYNVVRVENELMRFDSLSDTDRDVWTLRGCIRGFGSTGAAAHAAGAEAAGLIVPYGQNLVPDNHSTLLGELAQTYAGMLNRCQVSRVEFDGLEIHEYYGSSGSKMAELLYADLDHPTISNSSSGRPPAAWFEYNLNRVLAVPRNINAAQVRLRSDSQNASSLLMAHDACFPIAAEGSAAIGLQAGDRGFSVENFQRHGLHDAILGVMRTWRAISRAMNGAQRQLLDVGRSRDPNARLKQAGNHNEAPFVYVPEDQGDRWNIYPTRVLDTGNQDSLWYWGQENGPIEPWRFIKPNEPHTWKNPFAAQPLRFVLHVLPGTDYTGADNLALQPDASQLRQVGDTVFSNTPAGLQLTCANPRDQEAWHEDDLPVLAGALPHDFSRHRAIGLRVDGDGSGSVLVLQFSGGMDRDYAIPVDFVGRRYVEIPNGEASYALGAWGWRFGASKACNYSQVNTIRLGFGYLPARSQCRVVVSGLKALREIPVSLVNPTVVTPTGKLTIQGRVPPDHYLEYQGGGQAELYDANWNRVGEFPVTTQGAAVPSGDAVISVLTAQPGPLPWLGVEFLTRGDPITVLKNGTTK